jgi:hypothetical protein
VLKKILIVGPADTSLNDVVLTFNLGDTPLFRPNASAEIFSPSNPNIPELNLSVAKGIKVNGRVTNNTSGEIKLLIHLVYEA